MPLKKVIEQAEAAGRAVLSPVTQGQYLATFREMLDLAVKKRLIPVNPADGLRPLKRDDLSASEKRLPFTPAQLAAFFRSEFYTACAKSGSVPYRHGKKGGWRFWLPLLSLLTGLRPRELLQMHIDDVRRTTDGIAYLDVVASEYDEDDAATKSLKTALSRRRVPLHPILLKMGFLSFVEERRRKADEPRIFPGLKPNKYGDPAWYPLKRFIEVFLPREVPEKQSRQVFYSFRRRPCLWSVLQGARQWTPSARSAGQPCSRAAVQYLKEPGAQPVAGVRADRLAEAEALSGKAVAIDRAPDSLCCPTAFRLELAENGMTGLREGNR
jgi:integrase